MNGMRQTIDSLLIVAAGISRRAEFRDLAREPYFPAIPLVESRDQLISPDAAPTLACVLIYDCSASYFLLIFTIDQCIQKLVYYAPSM